MKLLLAVSILASLPGLSYAQDRFSQGEAAKVDAEQSAAAFAVGAASFGAWNKLDNFDNPLPGPFLDGNGFAVDVNSGEAVDNVLKAVNKTDYFAKPGARTIEVDMYDGGGFGSNTIYRLRPNSPEDLKSQLLAIYQKGGVELKETNLHVHGVRLGALGKGTLIKGLTFATIVSEVVWGQRLFSALNDLRGDPPTDAYCGPVACGKPSVIKRVWDAPAEPAFERDQAIAKTAGSAQ